MILQTLGWRLVKGLWPSRRFSEILHRRRCRMHKNFEEWLEQHRGRGFDLHSKHINPAFVKVLRAINFDRQYVRGEGAYLWDDEGNKYLDLLTGWGVFALGQIGRAH